MFDCSYQNIIVASLRIQMKYNNQLYQQFIERKASRSSSQVYAQTYKRRAILQKFIQLPDSTSLSLEHSIPLLRNLGVISKIDSVDHIVQLMEVKRNYEDGWQGAERQLWECRLIYFLWDVIAQESIEMRQFKELVLILINNESNRYQAIESVFGDKQEVSQLIETWDHIFQEPAIAITQQPEEITDISIIKTKNEGNLGDNKENIADNQNLGFATQRNSYNSQSQKNHSRSKSRLEKSYYKKTAKTTLEKSNSVQRVATKRSEPNSLANYVSSGINPINYFKDSDNLSIVDEKRLIDRLYNCDIYKKREEQKKKLQQQKIKVQLQQCTFKPSITRSSNAKSRAKIEKNIKGYEKAINRMKNGYLKKQEIKENLQFRMWKEGPTLNGKPTIGYAPKFHLRAPKEQKQELFELKFTLGRMMIPVKIRQSDRIGELVAHLGRIYSLKEYEKGYIHDSIIQALEEYTQMYGNPNESLLD